MSKVLALSKVLNVRELEKKNAQKEYHESLTRFENRARTLYEALKKKEEAEQFYATSLQQPTAIDVIKAQADYIEVLTKQILQLQIEVQKARNEMEFKQAILTEAHIEVKKFEKIIEFRKEEVLKQQQREERLMMDEISIQQYMSYQNR